MSKVMRVTGTLAATAAIALTVVGTASADAAATPDNVTVATAVDALGNHKGWSFSLILGSPSTLLKRSSSPSSRHCQDGRVSA